MVCKKSSITIIQTSQSDQLSHCFLIEWVVISFSTFLFHPNKANSDASTETAERHFIHHLNV